MKCRMHFRAALLIRTASFTKNQVVLTQNTRREHSTVCESERRGRHRVYFGAIWSLVVILGPELRLSILSDRWMCARSAHQGSHNISGYTQAALTGCQSVWREMLRGQTVFSLRRIPIHWQPAIITSLSLVVALFLTLEGKKKFVSSLIFNFFLLKVSVSEELN